MAIENDLDIVGEAKTCAEAVSKADELIPDVLLMDVRMLEAAGGMKAALAIKRKLPDVKVLFMSVHGGYMEDAIEAGADGYMMKDCQATDLIKKIREVCIKQAEFN
jgi:DNA-binding NarL/FixJ family response regulator